MSRVLTKFPSAWWAPEDIGRTVAGRHAGKCMKVVLTTGQQ
jgi:hypothetical protein